jgi:hypothetical protein
LRPCCYASLGSGVVMSLFSGMPRPRWSIGSMRQPWYQYITMQSGKAQSLYVFEHSQAMTAGLAKLAQARIKEAAAPKSKAD